MASIFKTNHIASTGLGAFWLRVVSLVVFSVIIFVGFNTSAFALDIYFGSKSGESGLCPNPEVKSSCICTEDYVIIIVPVYVGLVLVPTPVPIYRERCASVPNAFIMQSNVSEEEGEAEGGGALDLVSTFSSSTSSTFAYPRVRFAYYLWGSGVKVRHLGPGECEFVKGLRHCARLTYGDKQIGEDGYDSSKNYGNNLRLDTSGRSDTGVPLRLCVFEDPWDFKDTNGQFSPFHHNTSREEADDISKNMRASTWGDEKWMGSDSRVVSGWDSFWTLATGGSYNNNVATIVGCAPIPIAPMPPPFCDTCEVLPNVPDPNVVLKEGSTFEQPELLVELQSFRFDDANNSFKLTKVEDAVLPVGKCIPHEEKEYCATYCDQGADICFFENGEAMRIIRYIDRPDFMPLPVVEDVTENIDFPKMKVYVGVDPAVSSSLTYPNRVKAGSEPYTESAVLSVNEEGQECATLHGIEFCAERECYTYNQSTGECTERSPNVCLKGYEPEPFDVAGYHPSKGVLVDVDTGAIAPTQYNSQDAGKVYFDSKEFFSLPSNSLPVNLVERPFTPFELDLCIGGLWRWPAAVNSIHTVAETKSIDVDPACSEVEVTMWGGGAAGTFRVGGDNNAQNDHAGGSGGYVKARVPIVADDNVQIIVGSGGKEKGANGGSTSFRVNNIEMLRANGGNNRFGGGTFVKSGEGIVNISQTNGQSRDFRATGSQGVTGGKAPNRNEVQSGDDCEAGGNPSGENHWGGGGCVRDDYSGPTSGRWGKGGNGAISLVCTKYADSEPTLPPMPEVTTPNSN